MVLFGCVDVSTLATGTVYKILEVLGFMHCGLVQGSSFIPSALNSADVRPIQDSCIHWSQSSQAMLPVFHALTQSKKISNDQELIQSDPISCP